MKQTTKYKRIGAAAVLAAFFLLPTLNPAVFAATDDPMEYTVMGVETFELLEAPTGPALTPDPSTAPAPSTPEALADGDTAEIPPEQYPEAPERPFTPAGTGTVIDYAAEADGKSFYTITAGEDSVFYLVIDRQRGTENVYFLNAVTVDDLLPLAQNAIPAQGETLAPLAPSFAPAPASAGPESPAQTPPTPEPPNVGGNTGMMIAVAAIVVLGGGAGWYLKIYRPKHQGAGDGDEYEPSADGEPIGYPGDWGDPQDTPYLPDDPEAGVWPGSQDDPDAESAWPGDDGESGDTP